MAAVKVARALDEIIQRRSLEHPFSLYRHVAEKTGVHATTVLRYHTGYSKSAYAAVHKVVRELLVRARTGQMLPFESPPGGSATTQSSPRTRRVPTTRVRHAIDGLLGSMGMDTRRILFRCIAERSGLHASTVLRYYRGDLQSAPVLVLEQVERLREQIVGGETVVFHHGPGGKKVVLRERTRAIIEELVSVSGTDEARSYYRQLDRWLAFPPGTTRRICTDPDLRFVRASIHQAIEALVDGVEYDPIRSYQVGERIRHHVFGTGTVEEKIHKNKMSVAFLGGRQVILSEAVPEDPYRFLRSGGGGTLTERGA